MTNDHKTAPLFDSVATDIKHGQHKTLSASAARTHLFSQTDALAGFELRQGHATHYATAGEWSTHNLIEHLLDIMGEPAALMGVTWSASEDGIRTLVGLMNDGRLTDCELIFDWRIKVRNPAAHAFAKMQATKIKLTSCHAKVFLLRSANWKVTLITSANLTNNPRIEAGVVETSPDVFDFHAGWFEQELRHASPFFSPRRK